MAREAGAIVPDLATRVKPAPHLMFQWVAYHDLSADRQLGMSVGRIPFTAIDAYARRYGVDDLDEFDRFKRLITAMDGAFLKFRADRGLTS